MRSVERRPRTARLLQLGPRSRHRAPHALLRKAKQWGPVGFASANGWAGCRPTRGAGGGATGSASGAPQRVRSRTGQSALEYIVLLGTLGTLVAFSGPFFTRVQQQANATFGDAVALLVSDPQ